MNLHAEIMNIQIGKALPECGEARLAYKMGHRDARHAAAELVLGKGSEGVDQELIEALNETLTDLIGYQINARTAAKGDSAWKGVAEAIQPTIDQARKALAKTNEQKHD